ncbi:putative proline--tRNA ligase, mitochondrial [Trichinella britovi]|uniref:proline--tRNA ligase n=1 Tax=Trichinella britovi TaxID=45882 RepID=A0A0V1DB02_TRIBR|nr:putative proline--tRNA ligase, mitochondrial [Trichinella britovi]
MVYFLLSKIFQPIVSRPWKSISAVEMISKSQRLMLDNGLIEYVGGKGLFHYLPVGLRALEKLCIIIRHEMDLLGAGRMALSNLCERSVWEQTGRWEEVSAELLRLKDRKGKEYCLCPTHEESVTSLISRFSPITSSRLPLLLYQITLKYRDEPNPRFGLARAREFFMKDMYSFDLDTKSAMKTYDAVNKAYFSIFQTLGIKVHRVEAAVGSIGGNLSHEFHCESQYGEDYILLCEKCQKKFTEEVLVNSTTCPVCNEPFQKVRSLELAHTFFLGEKYSEALGATVTCNPESPIPLQMGCFGIGISRLLAAIVDYFSRDEEIRWPLCVAPYKVCVIPPKNGSREYPATPMALHLAEQLSSLANFNEEIVYDDRTHQTVGARLRDAKRRGYPYVIVANKTVFNKSSPKFELHCTATDEVLEVTHAELFQLKRRFTSIEKT